MVISATAEVADVRRALASGALGFIPKSYSGEEMLAALRQVLHGDVFVPGELWQGVFGAAPNDSEPGDAGSASIGERQLEVLRLTAQGHSNKQIGTILNIQEATVKSHVAALLRAFGANNRTACVREAARRNLITLAE